MGLTAPFNVDAATVSEQELARLPPHGGSAVTAFCGVDAAATDWDERGVCILRARKGFGKSHLLKVRSLNHRNSGAANRTLFYPQGSGRQRTLVDALSNVHGVVPRWLQGRDAATPWLHIWQLSILGLLVWITEARTPSPRGYSEWFGSLEALDQVHREHGPVAPEAEQPSVMLTMFMARILDRLPADDFNLGSNQLKQALSYAASDWAVAVASRLKQSGRQRIAMYLDAPDELVELDPPSLWRNVQQGLVLAIWRFSKSSNFSQMLNICATVRSEAFGSEHDHADIALAMGLVMPLQYDTATLKAMLCDRIRQADAARLTLPLASGVDPVHSLCGLAEVTHEDRDQMHGGRYTEDVFKSILRHTRMVPREVIAIAGAIYEIAGTRGFDTVSRTVNAEASKNIRWAIQHLFLGWNDALHRRFAASLKDEVIDGKSMALLAAQFKEDGPRIIKFFVQHGLLGTAERAPQRHRHYYRQRFAFDEVHGHDDSYHFRSTTMNTRQWLVSGATALSIIGSAGFAYAQTSSTEAVGSGSAAATPSGRVEGSTNASTTDATLTPNAASTSSTPDSSTSGDLSAVVVIRPPVVGIYRPVAEVPEGISKDMVDGVILPLFRRPLMA